MKKIFAIALALVMVLSMASAFASACTAGFDWTTTSVNACGKAKVEVVPYVKVADNCGDFAWKVSECAGTVKGENVYFAVKMVVDANPDPEFFETLALELEAKNVTDAFEWPDAIDYTNVDQEADKEEVYYLSTAGAWDKVAKTGISVADDVEAEDSLYIFKAEAASSTKVEVCATLTAGTNDDFLAGVVGKYYVVVDLDEDETGSVTVYEKEGAAAPIVTYAVTAGKVSDQLNGTEGCAPYTVADVEAFLGLDNNVKVTQKLVNKNFGWEYEQEDCFKWAGATAIVDADCVVAIPKTGDASLLAWLF